jgi:hypothetical protein
MWTLLSRLLVLRTAASVWFAIYTAEDVQLTDYRGLEKIEALQEVGVLALQIFLFEWSK